MEHRNSTETEIKSCVTFYFIEAVHFGHDRIVVSLLRHGASWSEDGIGDLLCVAVGMT